MNRFRQFYIDNGNRLFAYLLRKSGSAHVAADLVQESFTRYLERYRHREQSPALLFTIGRNLFYDSKRFDCRFVHDMEMVERASIGQEESYLAKEASGRLLAAMEHLSDEERDILSLVAGGGLDYREISEIHRCSVANVKVKVHRARQKLKELLRENEHG